MKQIGNIGRRRQGGFNLIEVSIAVVIGILVLSGVAYFVQRGFAGSDISKEANNISALIANTKILRSSGTYGASGTSLLPQLRVSKGLPSALTDDGTNVTNSWSGAVGVASTGGGYTVSYAAVPQDACLQLATTISDGAVISTTINGTANTGAVSSALATTQCNSATANAIVFTTAN